MTQHLWQIKNEGDLIMKQAKKFMAAILVLTMVSAAAPMSVYAGTITESEDPQN